MGKAKTRRTSTCGQSSQFSGLSFNSARAAVHGSAANCAASCLLEQLARQPAGQPRASKRFCTLVQSVSFHFGGLFLFSVRNPHTQCVLRPSLVACVHLDGLPIFLLSGEASRP